MAAHSFALKEDNGGFLTENKEERTFSWFYICSLMQATTNKCIWHDPKRCSFIGMYLEMPVPPFLCHSNSNGWLTYIYCQSGGGREAENFCEVWNFSFCIFCVVLRKLLLSETPACPTVFMSWRHHPCHLWCPAHTSRPCSPSMGKWTFIN